MNTVIIAFLIVINAFAILLNLKMLAGIPTNKKAMLIIVEEIVLFIIMNIVYSFCITNITIKNPSLSRNFNVFTFMGIDMMIICAPISKLISKYIDKDIKEAEFRSKLKIKIILAIIILIIESLYIKSLLKIV